jgi:ERF superfamily
MTDETPKPKNIDEALFILQQNPPVLLKDQDGQVGSQKTKYADLVQANERILSRLTALGVLWKTLPTTVMIKGPNGQEDPRFMLRYTLLHVESGTSEQGLYPLPAGANPMQNGSAITYARRYALIAATNTVAEGMDDDGQGYRGRQGGMAQRANVRQELTAPVAQRQQGPAPATRSERARPPAQPDLPARPTPPAPTEQPSAENGPHRGRGGLITEPMARKLAIVMKECGLTDGNDRRSFLVDLVSRPLDTSKDLTFDEGRGLIDAFEKAKASQDPQSEAAAIYMRTTGEIPAAAPVAGPPSVAEQTRAAVVGTPAGPDDRAPWDDEQQALL